MEYRATREQLALTITESAADVSAALTCVVPGALSSVSLKTVSVTTAYVIVRLISVPACGMDSFRSGRPGDARYARVCPACATPST